MKITWEKVKSTFLSVWESVDNLFNEPVKYSRPPENEIEIAISVADDEANIDEDEGLDCGCGHVSPSDPLQIPVAENDQGIGLDALPERTFSPILGVSDDHIASVAADLGVEVCAIKSVAHVESSGSAYYASGKPVIKYERHIFDRETESKFSTIFPLISNSSMRHVYGEDNNYDLLYKAVNLDRDAALKSVSWGKFQIMGFNYKAAGYSNVEDFVTAMHKSEKIQFDAFVSFLKNDSERHAALKEKNWEKFTAKYNGGGWRKTNPNYPTRMKDFYEACVKESEEEGDAE